MCLWSGSGQRGEEGGRVVGEKKELSGARIIWGFTSSPLSFSRQHYIFLIIIVNPKQ